MDTLQWYFELIDKMSGPAKAISGAVSRVNTSLKQARGAAAGFGNGTTSVMGRAVSSATSFAKAAGEVTSGVIAMGGSMANIASTAMSAASSILQIGASFASVALDALAFKDESLASLEVLTGSAQGGQVAFNVARAVDRVTSFDTRGVVDATRGIRAAGFDERQFDSIFALSSDLAAMSGKGTQGLELATYALGQINNAGRLYTQDLRQVLSLGLSRQRFNEAIARRMNLRETGPRLAQRVNKMLEKGRIDSTVAIAAIMDSVQAQTGGSQLGTLSRRMGESLSGQLSNIKNSFQNFFLNLDLNSPGLVSLRAFLQNLSSALDGSSEAGRQLQSIFTSAMNSIGGALGSIKPSDIAQAFLSIAEAARLLMPVFATMGVVAKTLGRTFAGITIVGIRPLFVAIGRMGNIQAFQVLMRNVGGVLGFVASTLVWMAYLFGFIFVVAVGGTVQVVIWLVQALGWLVGALGRAAGWIGDTLGGWATAVGQFFTNLYQQFIYYGSLIIQGLITGIRSGIDAAGQAVRDVGSHISNSVKGFFGIHSPSTLMMGYGRNITAGLAMGIDSGSAEVNASLGSVTAIPTVSARSAGGNTVTVQIMVDARGATDPDAVGNAVAEIAPAKLAEALAGLL